MAGSRSYSRLGLLVRRNAQARSEYCTLDGNALDCVGGYSFARPLTLPDWLITTQLLFHINLSPHRIVSPTPDRRHTSTSLFAA